MGIVGGLGMVVVALGGFAILFAMGQRQPAPVAPTFPAQATPPPTLPPAPGQDPGSPTTAPTSPPVDSAPSRTSNAFYSIRIPDGFQDVTDDYRARHPAERNAVQALAGRPGSATPDASIVVGRLPSGADRGRTLDRLAADRVRALERAGAGGAGALRHTSIGPDPAVEVDLTVRSGGQELRRTQVLCIHGDRLWEIAVTGPTASASDLAQAWTTVKTGWQWR